MKSIKKAFLGKSGLFVSNLGNALSLAYTAETLCAYYNSAIFCMLLLLLHCVCDYVPTVGIGTSGLSGLHGDTDEEEAKKAVICAINNGVNFIDTAPYYNNRR